MPTPRSVCVYCGSKSGGDDAYTRAAIGWGHLLAEHDVTLVYGAGSIGLMGVVADAVLDAGGRVIGVIPEHLDIHEVTHQGLTELHVVGTMHERKAKMEQLSDAFVALPGGIGTLEELAEILTWSQLGIHRKPVGCLDVQGFFAPLQALVDHMVATGFVKEKHRRLLMFESEPDALWERLCTWEAPPLPKWLTRTDL